MVAWRCVRKQGKHAMGFACLLKQPASLAASCLACFLMPQATDALPSFLMPQATDGLAFLPLNQPMASMRTHDHDTLYGIGLVRLLQGNMLTRFISSLAFQHVSGQVRHGTHVLRQTFEAVYGDRRHQRHTRLEPLVFARLEPHSSPTVCRIYAHT